MGHGRVRQRARARVMRRPAAAAAEGMQGARVQQPCCMAQGVRGTRGGAARIRGAQDPPAQQGQLRLVVHHQHITGIPCSGRQRGSVGHWVRLELRPAGEPRSLSPPALPSLFTTASGPLPASTCKHRHLAPPISDPTRPNPPPPPLRAPTPTIVRPCAAPQRHTQARVPRTQRPHHAPTPPAAVGGQHRAQARVALRERHVHAAHNVLLARQRVQGQPQRAAGQACAGKGACMCAWGRVSGCVCVGGGALRCVCGGVRRRSCVCQDLVSRQARSRRRSRSRPRSSGTSKQREAGLRADCPPCSSSAALCLPASCCPARVTSEPYPLASTAAVWRRVPQHAASTTSPNAAGSPASSTWGVSARVQRVSAHHAALCSGCGVA